MSSDGTADARRRQPALKQRPCARKRAGWAGYRRSREDNASCGAAARLARAEGRVTCHGELEGVKGGGRGRVEDGARRQAVDAHGRDELAKDEAKGAAGDGGGGKERRRDDEQEGAGVGEDDLNKGGRARARVSSAKARTRTGKEDSERESSTARARGGARTARNRQTMMSQPLTAALGAPNGARCCRGRSQIGKRRQGQFCSRDGRCSERKWRQKNAGGEGA
jgi:hypothetical protein